MGIADVGQFHVAYEKADRSLVGECRGCSYVNSQGASISIFKNCLNTFTRWLCVSTERRLFACVIWMGELYEARLHGSSDLQQRVAAAW